MKVITTYDYTLITCAPPTTTGSKGGGWVGGEAEEVGENSTVYKLMTQSGIKQILCASNREKHQPKALRSLYKKTEVLCKKGAASLVQFSPSCRIHRLVSPLKKRTDGETTVNISPTPTLLVVQVIHYSGSF